jgi:heparan-alpha-glucosaminide N-acetyltransferase
VSGSVRRSRLLSLDTCRGLLLFVNVAAISLLAPQPDQLRHATWIGVSAIDTIFPVFVTLSGFGLALAYRKRVTWRRTLRRSAVLLVCGLGYNAVMAGSVDLATWRLTGVLQVYAVLVLVIGLLHRFVRGAAGWMGVTAVAAAGQAAVLWLWQGSCPGGVLTPECNPSATIDPAVFGTAHVYAFGARGHDPEGLVAVLGALVTISVGVTAAHLMFGSRKPLHTPVRLAAWAAAAFVAGAAAAQVLPAMKRLWTTPFALMVAAGAVFALAVASLLLDQPAGARVAATRERLVTPLVAMGRNSLLIYFGSHLVLHVLDTRGGETSWADELARSLEPTGYPRASFIVAMVALWVVVAAVLHRRRIYIRA